MPLRIDHAIDLHCHFGPDTIGGPAGTYPHHSVTGVEAAREAAASGHAAIVLKSHSFPSTAVAATLSELVPGIQVFGGMCTDHLSGGLNVEGVAAALALGARIVWLPTVHSRQDLPDRGIAVTDDGGRPLPAVHEIFGLVREHDAILATGHVTAAEHVAVVREFGRRGKVLVTHAGEALAGPRLDADQCAELADLGATIELTAQLCQSVFGTRARSPNAVARMIRRIGPGRVALSTDYGWTRALPRPATGLGEFLESLWGEEGISEAELSLMASATPARLLGVDVA